MLVGWNSNRVVDLAAMGFLLEFLLFRIISLKSLFVLFLSIDSHR